MVPPVDRGEAGRCLVAANGSALGGVARARRCNRNDQDPSANPGHHQPMGWRRRRVEEWVARSDVEHVTDTKMRVFEEVRSLGIDLKWRVFLERIEIEELLHPLSV